MILNMSEIMCSHDTSSYQTLTTGKLNFYTKRPDTTVMKAIMNCANYV